MAVVAALIVLAGGAPRSMAATCPAILDNADRLVLVTSEDENASQVHVQTISRRAGDGSWQSARIAMRGTIGRNGMAWGDPYRRYKRNGERVKHEGDERTPAGIYAIGSSFGFKASTRPGHVVLKADQTICVDDPVSPAYNTITTRSRVGRTVSAENMGRIALYREGLFVTYPSSRRRRAGSCIFFHVWRNDSSGTAGCIALSEVNVRRLQAFATPGTVVAILPRTAMDRFKGCLPDAGP